MSQHKKNLLEAFRSAGSNPEPSAPAPRVEPRSPIPAPPPPPSSAGRAGLGMPQPPRWLFAVVGLALAFAFGFLTGRLGQGEARAGDEKAPDASAAPERSATPPPSERRVTPVPVGGAGVPVPKETPSERLEESSLFDTRNTHTIIVATYDRQAEDLAWATYNHLVDARLPAFPPVVSGKHLVVLVGAAGAYSDLESEEQAVRALERGGERPYSGAYRVRIDSILTRSK